MNLKKINLIAFPTAILLVIYRFFQLLLAVDPVTGFSKSPIYDIVLYAILGALLLFLIFKIYYGRVSIPSPEAKPSKLVSYSLIIFAVICEFMSVLKLPEIQKLSLTDNSNIRLITIVETICAVLGILVGICIVFECVKAMSLSYFRTPNLFVCCVVIIYFVILLFTFYATHDTMVTVSQNLIGLFFWMSAAIFAYAYCRYLSHSKTATSYKLAVTFGLFTAVCGFVTTLPQIICSFFVSFQFTSFDNLDYILILPTAVVVAIITLKLPSSVAAETEE